MYDGYMMIKAGKNPLDYLEPGYVFMKYTYVLVGPPLATYHRDVTSSKTIFNTQYPTYTFLQYNYSGNFLSVCPGSHREWTCDFPITLSGRRGDGVLFDCDLVHGELAGPSDRVVTEYKIVHYHDIPQVLHLDGVDVYKKGIGVPLWQEICMRITSYIFVVPIQWFMGRQYGGILGFLHYNNYKGD
jgi:hypothetical protein